MRLNTASGIISFVRQLESDGAEFYESLSRHHDQFSETFLALARENKKNISEVERAYYSVITDAIEGCFSFDLETDPYTFDKNSADPGDFRGNVSKALEIEDKITGFYLDAADQSGRLMADVPRVFKLIARKRGSRPSKLNSLEVI